MIFMKKIAMYLPQFHTIPENDAWWGEGFTEWTAVKKAEPLFEGHHQPRIPGNRDYYNLLQKETMEWQASLMKKNSVDGLCFYHYWFGNGKMLLEKPAENLLKWKSIDMPFCFSWANETWARSWTVIRNKNVWSNLEEKEGNDPSSDGVLLQQIYGEEAEWEAHFRYLLPFFRDERYLKKDGKPIFLIYRSADIPCLEEMLSAWKKLAEENGLPGLFIIASNYVHGQRKGVDALLRPEPGSSIERVLQREPALSDGVRMLDYDLIWETILSAEDGNGVLYGGFVDYDDTPRRGSEGMVVIGMTPLKFREYATRLIAKNAANDSEFVFLNAWNEWGEGMYLEPDEQHGEALLEAIAYAKKHYPEYLQEYREQREVYKDQTSEINGIELLRARESMNLRALSEWLYLKQDGFSPAGYLKEKGIIEIGIYGYGVLGKHLLKECRNEGITVKYIIEKNKAKVHTGIPVYTPEEADALEDIPIIVTALYYYDEICRVLEGKGLNNVISCRSLIQRVREHMGFGG